MSDKKLGQESAFSGRVDELSKGAIQVDSYEWVSKGMSKRLYIATDAMQGMLANPNDDLVCTINSNLIREAYALADELLKQEQL